MYLGIVSDSNSLDAIFEFSWVLQTSCVQKYLFFKVTPEELGEGAKATLSQREISLSCFLFPSFLYPSFPSSLPSLFKCLFFSSRVKMCMLKVPECNIWDLPNYQCIYGIMDGESNHLKNLTNKSPPFLFLF